jgi:hypothetical protein
MAKYGTANHEAVPRPGVVNNTSCALKISVLIIHHSSIRAYFKEAIVTQKGGSADKKLTVDNWILTILVLVRVLSVFVRGLSFRVFG